MSAGRGKAVAVDAWALIRDDGSYVLADDGSVITWATEDDATRSADQHLRVQRIRITPIRRSNLARIEAEIREISDDVTRLIATPRRRRT